MSELPFVTVRIAFRAYTAPPISLAVELTSELWSIVALAPILTCSAPPYPCLAMHPVIRQLSSNVSVPVTFARPIIIAPPYAMSPRVSVTDSSQSLAPSLTEKNRERYWASKVAPAPSEAISRSIAVTMM
eukprot:3305037-Prymnesium_polylepis.2